MSLPGARQGKNQRLALWHGILIKENHIAAAGSVTAALKNAQALNAGVDIQIEWLDNCSRYGRTGISIKE